jgi:hypothetical protein
VIAGVLEALAKVSNQLGVGGRGQPDLVIATIAGGQGEAIALRIEALDVTRHQVRKREVKIVHAASSLPLLGLDISTTTLRPATSKRAPGTTGSAPRGAMPAAPARAVSMAQCQTWPSISGSAKESGSQYLFAIT